MGEFSLVHWLIVAAIVLIVFGGRRIPEVMKGLGEGIRSFKDGVSGSAASSSAAASASAVALLAPSGVAAKASAGQVVITWNPATSAASYNVKRSSASGGPYALIASTAANAHTDAGLANGTYYYVVTTVGASGESANSIEVAATIS